jgi:hypothetical protein
VKDVLYFRLGGLPCGVCGWPALWGEVHPNGVVSTSHRGPERQPCRSLGPSVSSRQDTRRVMAVRARPPDLVRLRLLAAADRRAS